MIIKEFDKIDLDDEYQSLIYRMKIIDLQITSSGIVPDEVCYYQHRFFIRIYKHVLSINTMMKQSIQLEGNVWIYVNDYSGILLLIRSIMEAVLLHYYIYNESIEKDIVYSKFLLWKRQGLITRQKFTPMGDESKVKLAIEKVKISEIEKELEKSSYFQEFYKKLIGKNKKDYETFGKWAPSWKKIVDILGLTIDIKNSIYSYFSSHAHSEYLGFMQDAEMDRESEFTNQINTQLHVFIGLTNLFLYQFAISFPISIQLPKTEIEEIKFWHRIMVGKNVNNKA